jgi:hypothetical protein
VLVAQEELELLLGAQVVLTQYFLQLHQLVAVVVLVVVLEMKHWSVVLAAVETFLLILEAESLEQPTKVMLVVMLAMQMLMEVEAEAALVQSALTEQQLQVVTVVTE